MERLRDEGVSKWLGLAGCILALEYIGDESLTHAAHRALEHPIGRIAVPAGLALTAAHLLDLIPHQYDPYYLLAKGIDYAKRI